MEFAKNVIMETFYDELKIILSSIVVKIPEYVKRGETVEAARKGQEYLDAVDEYDNFRTYVFYEKEVLIVAGVPQNIIEDCVIDKNKIPEKYRDDVVIAKRAYIIKNYKETNPYYMKYNGLPENYSEYIYFTREEYDKYGVPNRTPIHEIDDEVLKMLRIDGVIDLLIEKYPSLDYLKYMGDCKISIYIMRKAGNFQIMQSYTSYSDSINNDFNDFYLKAREYILHEVYDDAFAMDSEYYDAFMGMNILFMCVQLTTAHYIRTGIKMDFYDKKTLNFIFNGYGIYFYEDIPAIYLRRLLKNLNSLLRWKGTNKVIVDICSLFGFDNIEIMSYYLLKDRKYDSEGMPVFEYREVINEDGEYETKENYERMYDLNFVQVSEKTKNILEDLDDRSNHYEYDIFVSDDPYWNPDEESYDFKQKIFEMEFNYIQTKYFSLKTVYDIIKMSFEVQYFFRMMVELKPNIELIKVPMGKIDATVRFKLFDIVILLFALVCKKYKYSGSIITDPVSVANVLGFNFQCNVDYIIELSNALVDGNGRKNDHNNYVVDFNPKTMEDVSTLVYNFFSNKNTHDVLIQKRYEAETIEDYNIYEKLYRATMITEDNNTIYTKPNGEIAETYLDYLKNTEPSMGKYVEKLENDGQINDAIEYTLTVLNDLFMNSGFDYLFQNLPGIGQDTLKKYIFDVIRIFKSFTVDLKSLNIYYIFDDKYMHNFKLLEKIIIKKNWLDNDRITNIIDNMLNSSEGLLDGKLVMKDIISLMMSYLNMSSSDLTKIQCELSLTKFNEYFTDIYPESLLEKMVSCPDIHERSEIDPYISSMIALLKMIENIYDEEIRFEMYANMATALTSLLDILSISSDVKIEDSRIQIRLKNIMNSISNTLDIIGIDDFFSTIKNINDKDSMSIEHLLSFCTNKKINYRGFEILVYALFSMKGIVRNDIILSILSIFKSTFNIGVIGILVDQLNSHKDWSINIPTLVSTVYDNLTNISNDYTVHSETIKHIDDTIIYNALYELDDKELYSILDCINMMNDKLNIFQHSELSDYSNFISFYKHGDNLFLNDDTLFFVLFNMYASVHAIDYIIANKLFNVKDIGNISEHIKMQTYENFISNIITDDSMDSIKYERILELVNFDDMIKNMLCISEKIYYKLELKSHIARQTNKFINDVYNLLSKIWYTKSKLIVGEILEANIVVNIVFSLFFSTNIDIYTDTHIEGHSCNTDMFILRPGVYSKENMFTVKNIFKFNYMMLSNIDEKIYQNIDIDTNVIGQMDLILDDKYQIISKICNENSSFLLGDSIDFRIVLENTIDLFYHLDKFFIKEYVNTLNDIMGLSNMNMDDIGDITNSLTSIIDNRLIEYSNGIKLYDIYYNLVINEYNIKNIIKVFRNNIAIHDIGKILLSNVSYNEEMDLHCFETLGNGLNVTVRENTISINEILIIDYQYK